jgi:hypothetical protein
MIHTRTCLGTLIFGICFAIACSQKDPNEGLDTDDTDTTDTSSDQSDDSNVSPTTSISDSSTTGEPDSTDSTDPQETSDAVDSGEPDAGETTDDSTSTDSTSTDPTSTDTSEEICPMVAGATWTYKHTDWTEVQTVTTIEYEDEPAFLVKDTPDPEDNLRADTVLVKRDGRLLRLYKEEFFVNANTGAETLETKATYGVGFVRCDEAWASKEPGWSETPEYERVETIGTDAPKPAESRSHTFTVEGRENVSTSGGKSYSNCVKVRRSKDWAAVETAEDATEKLYWFCPGVGKVREQNVETGKFEDLTAYSIP